jgi:hypothetical protein
MASSPINQGRIHQLMGFGWVWWPQLNSDWNIIGFFFCRHKNISFFWNSYMRITCFDLWRPSSLDAYFKNAGRKYMWFWIMYFVVRPSIFVKSVAGCVSFAWFLCSVIRGALLIVLLAIPVLAQSLLGVFLYMVWFCCYVLNLLFTFLSVFMLFGTVLLYNNEYFIAALDMWRMGPFRTCRTLCQFSITYVDKRIVNLFIFLIIFRNEQG